MQTKAESILRTINNTSGKYNILTFPTHEAYQSNWSSLPHTFYLFQGQGIKPWSNKYRQLPKNHILLDGSEEQVKLDMKFDIVLSQNKFGQYQVAKQAADHLGLPLVSIEHTLPVPQWTQKQRDGMLQMRGDINVFISEYSIKQWGFDPNDPTIRVIHHAIQSDRFTQRKSETISTGNLSRNTSILVVVNDYINRDWCCGWSIFTRVTDGLPVVPLGDTPGFSKPAKDLDDLIQHYQDCAVFLNTSTISPVPTALLEAMSCGCPVVTTATCQIPEIVKNGINGWISNDEKYLKDRLIWCLKNPEEARNTIGKAARETILSKFSLEKHLESWNNVFKEVYGKALRK
jgi:hypothetical protein